MKHNNQLPNGHFRKQWQERVKTWLDQAGRKKSRRVARSLKAKNMGTRPVDLLRPVVRCQTLKYNTRVRAGRGFTLEEIKAAGITRSHAMKIGISVDHRRRNKCEESLEINKQRLLSYLDRVVILTKESADIQSVSALKNAITVDHSIEAPRLPTEEEKNSSAYATQRKAWGIKRHHGIRAKRALEKEQAADSGKK